MSRLYRNRAKEVAAQQALIARISARGDRQIRREIESRMIRMANSYERNGDIGVDMAMSGHNENIENALLGLWSQSIEAFAGRVQVGKSRNIKASSAYEEIIKQWFARYAYDKIMRITMTTKDQVREIIMRGIKDGLTVDNITKSIKELAPTLSKYRSHVIARTEVHGSGNFGSISAARDIDAGLKKEWLTANDERVRGGDIKDEFDHVDADGQVVELDKPFEVSGEWLDYPGDSQGSAGNVIKCRCVVGYRRNE